MRPYMRSEIGGAFSLSWSHLWRRDLGQHSAFISPGSNYFLTSSGRASMRLILREILKLGQSDEALLPAYLFQGLLSPFKESKVTVKFYKLKEDLSLDASDIERKMSRNTKVLWIMHYFGFPQPVEQLNRLREAYPSCAVVEDIAQAFLTSRMDASLGRFGDFNFNVYTKIVPIPDGSLLKSNRPIADLHWRNWQFKHIVCTGTRYTALILKDIYMKGYPVPKKLYLFLFNYADRLCDEYPIFAHMSWVSRRLVDKMDWEGIVARRRENYQHLLDNWDLRSIVPLFSNLPGSVCPMGFVVLSENRDYIRSELIKAKIYCPVHWHPTIGGEGHRFSSEIDHEEFPASWEIARKIMMIPIDQRYGIEEMNRILEQLRMISNHMEAR